MGENDQSDRYKIERETLKEVSEIKTDIAVLKKAVETVENTLESLVTRPEFTPVKLLAYGMAGSLLAGIVAALLATVIK